MTNRNWGGRRHGAGPPTNAAKLGSPATGQSNILNYFGSKQEEISSAAGAEKNHNTDPKERSEDNMAENENTNVDLDDRTSVESQEENVSHASSYFTAAESLNNNPWWMTQNDSAMQPINSIWPTPNCGKY